MKERIRSAPDGGYLARIPGTQPTERAAVKEIPPQGTGTSFSPNQNGIERVLRFYQENPRMPVREAARVLRLSPITVNSYRSMLIQAGSLERLK